MGLVRGPLAPLLRGVLVIVIVRWRLVFIVVALLLAGCVDTDPNDGEDDEAGEGVASLEGVGFEEVASGFDEPLLVVNAGDGSGRLFVAEKPGTVWIMQDGETLEAPFLDIQDRVGDAGFEQGLLGLAFPPGYDGAGVFYVAYTDTSGSSILARHQVGEEDPNKAVPGSEEVLLEVMQPFQNHNGGHLSFGPDGYLYHGLGDGGAAGDPQQHAQNTGSLLGSMLRLDVSPSTGYAIPEDNPFVDDPESEDEIWAYGLRNPWRWSFDAATGDLYIADVGQDEWEEVNVQPANSTGGENYGWNVYEGEDEYATGPPASTAPDAVFPVAVYSIQDDDCSVIGGHVYRGEDVPALEGTFVLGDWCSGIIRLLEQGQGGWELQTWKDTSMSITSFGTDEEGELYVVDQQGAIHRFVTEDAA